MLGVRRYIMLSAIHVLQAPRYFLANFNIYLPHLILGILVFFFPKEIYSIILDTQFY